MMRIMFFIMGLPMLIMSFFEAIDIMPYVDSVNLLSDGKEIVLTQEEQEGIHSKLCQIFEKAHTLPAFGVMTEEMFSEYASQGKIISLKFGAECELLGLPFDELVFKIEPESQGFDLIRGMNGVFQGRCIHIDLMENNLAEFSALIDQLAENHIKTEVSDQVGESVQGVENLIEESQEAKDAELVEQNDDILENQILNTQVGEENNN